MAKQSLAPRGTSLNLVLPALLPILVLALAVSTLPPLVDEAEAQVSRGVGRVRGKVNDPDGNPLEGVRVVLTHTDTGDSVETTTDENGSWAKGNLGSGNWNVDFFADGYSSMGVSTQVRQTGRPPVIEVTMEPGGDRIVEDAAESPFGKALREGNELYQAQDFAAALMVFEQVLVDFPEHENLYLAYINAGNVALELERFDLARQYYDTALAANMMSVDALLGLAKSYLLERRIDEAMEKLAMIDPATIEDPIVFYNVAVLLYDEGQPAESVQYFELALERDPEFIDAHMQIAVAMLRTGDNEGARAHLEKVIELAPDSEKAAEAQSFLEIIGE